MDAHIGRREMGGRSDTHVRNRLHNCAAICRFRGRCDRRWWLHSLRRRRTGDGNGTSAPIGQSV